MGVKHTIVEYLTSETDDEFSLEWGPVALFSFEQRRRVQRSGEVGGNKANLLAGNLQTDLSPDAVFLT